jgi:transcriptional regulator with XRE-family HTH domain
MPPKPGSKAYRDQQRERLARLGVGGRQLTEQLVTDLIRCGYRPREAWRMACELTQHEVAARFNQIRGDPDSSMRGSRVCEHEKWPIGGVRPSVRTLKILAAVYETTWDRLVDVDDLEKMPPSDRQAFLDISDLRYNDSLDLPAPRQHRHHPSVPHGGDDSPVTRPVTAEESVTVSQRATCTLPVDTVAFTGRGTEVHEVIAAVTAAAEAGRMVAIHAIDGMPGVGKTALAVRIGHLLAGRFPVGAMTGSCSWTCMLTPLASSRRRRRRRWPAADDAGGGAGPPADRRWRGRPRSPRRSR